MEDVFVFQAVEEAFYRRIAPAIAFAAHARDHAVLGPSGFVSFSWSCLLLKCGLPAAMMKQEFRLSDCPEPPLTAWVAQQKLRGLIRPLVSGKYGHAQNSLCSLKQIRNKMPTTNNNIVDVMILYETVALRN